MPSTIDRIEGDSGVADDFQTNDTTLTVSGSLEKVIASDERVEISTDGGATWTTATVDGTNWSFEDPTAQDASFTYEARIAGPGDSVGATAEQAVTIDTVVNVAPPVVAVSQDEGVESPDTADDFVTNVVSPTVSGSATLALDETLQIQVDGGAWVDVVVDAETGAWNYQAVTTETNPDTGEENDVPVVYANGDAVIFTTRVVDDAGNVSEPVARTITIDTSADTDANAFTVTVDEGFEVTNATESEGVRVTLAGIDADAASVAVTFSDETENTVTADVTQDENGVWTVTATDLSGLADGPITVSAVVTDISGNTADAVVDTLVLDTSVSEAGGSGTTTVTIDGVTQDTDATPDTENDFVTNVVSPTVRGSATLALDETLQIQVNDGAWVDVVVDAETREWTYNDGNDYADTDEVVYTTRIVDAAGNVGTTTVTQTVTIDTSVSEAGGSGTTTVTIDGVTQDTDATPDTENDFVTNVVSPTVRGSATLVADETLQIQVNDGAWVDVVVDAETREWTYNDGNDYADTDKVVYTTRIVDAAGNVGTTTVTQTVTIDTSVSEAGGSGTTTVTIDGVTQDTGATPDTENDFVTNVVSPTVRGSATLVADETLQIQVNDGAWVDVVVDAETREWTYNDGNDYADTDKVVYTTRIVDAAGNVGTTTVTQTVTIDTSVSEAGGSGTTTVTIDGVTQDTDATPDTENDFVTNVVSPTVRGSATLVADETLQIQVNDGAWVDVVVDAETREWTYNDGNDYADTDKVVYTTRIVDAAGNVGTTTVTQTVTIDTSVSEAGGSGTTTVTIDGVTQDTDATPDTENDFVTNVVSPTVRGSATLVADETLQIQVNDGAWVDVVVDAETREWTYNDGNDYADTDKVVYTTRIVDAAGNVGTTTVTQTVTIDTSVSEAGGSGTTTVTIDGVTQDTDATPDTENDFVTNVVSPTVRGSATLVADETLQIQVNDGAWVDVVVDAETREWTYNDGNDYADTDEVVYTTRIVDAAGNVGTTTVTQTVTIDTSVSEAGGSGTTTVTIDGVTQDTGATPDTENDFVTNVVSPTVRGSATLVADETLQIQVNDGAWVDVVVDAETREWTYNDGNDYADTDEVVYTTRIVDAAGNVGTTTVTQTVTIDTSVSEAGGSGTTTVTIDGVTQDTGATPDTENDFVTNVVSPTVSGSATLALDETLQIQVNGGALG